MNQSTRPHARVVTLRLGPGAPWFACLPVRLRYQDVHLSTSRSCSAHTCLLAQTLAQFHSIELFKEGQHGDRKRNGYWQVKVYAGPDPLTGKQRFGYDRAKTKCSFLEVLG
jgi:hypothetical protein